MSPIEAIKICYSKYANFEGRASRSEYWYFTIYIYLTLGLVSILTPALTSLEVPFIIFLLIFGLGNFLPQIGAAVRRLHDINVSGWWLLLPVPFAFLPAGFKFVPALINIGLWIAMMFPGNPNKNKYGDPIK